MLHLMALLMSLQARLEERERGQGHELFHRVDLLQCTFRMFVRSSGSNQAGS